MFDQALGQGQTKKTTGFALLSASLEKYILCDRSGIVAWLIPLSKGDPTDVLEIESTANVSVPFRLFQLAHLLGAPS